jgi:hypothetical protein
MARLVAAMLVLTLTGPSLVPLVCEWACASEHQSAADSTSVGCHEHGPQAGTAALSAGHVCHDPIAGALLVRPPTWQPTQVAVPARAPDLAPPDSAYRSARTLTPRLGPPGSARILPPLRI